MQAREHNEEYFYVHGKDIYSTQSLLARMGVNQSHTIYRRSSNDFVRWPFSAADFFEIVEGRGADSDGAEARLEGADRDEVGKINAEIRGYKDSGSTVANRDRIRELRARKREILARAAPSAAPGGASIFYKTFVEINDCRMVEERLPQFRDVRWPFREQMPYFTAGLEDFARAVKNGERTAVTGGPCFFGEHEVDMIWTLRDGSRKVYDFTTRRRSSGDRVSLEAEFTRRNACDVVDVSFESRKKLLTTEEYDAILYLFELARATGSCLTLPIVDASYQKYLDAMLGPLPEEIRERAHARFREVARPVVAMYGELFGFFRSRYPEVECTMMSGETPELLEKFYERRAKFVGKPSTERIISGIREKVESVKDYITLPALPFYLYGVRNILEVDYLGETDSFWKCRKMHKGELSLSALLYPIRMSADGWRTLFSTEPEYKEYIRREDYGRR